MNPFTEKPNMSGASISGDGPNNRWMVLDFNKDENLINNPHRVSVVVHEYFHVYQIALSDEFMSPTLVSECGSGAGWVR